MLHSHRPPFRDPSSLSLLSLIAASGRLVIVIAAALCCAPFGIVGLNSALSALARRLARRPQRESIAMLIALAAVTEMRYAEAVLQPAPSADAELAPESPPAKTRSLRSIRRALAAAEFEESSPAVLPAPHEVAAFRRKRQLRRRVARQRALKKAVAWHALLVKYLRIWQLDNPAEFARVTDDFVARVGCSVEDVRLPRPSSASSAALVPLACSPSAFPPRAPGCELSDMEWLKGFSETVRVLLVRAGVEENPGWGINGAAAATAAAAAVPTQRTMAEREMHYQVLQWCEQNDGTLRAGDKLVVTMRDETLQPPEVFDVTLTLTRRTGANFFALSPATAPRSRTYCRTWLCTAMSSGMTAPDDAFEFPIKPLEDEAAEEQTYFAIRRAPPADAAAASSAAAHVLPPSASPVAPSLISATTGRCPSSIVSSAPSAAAAAAAFVDNSNAAGAQLFDMNAASPEALPPLEDAASSIDDGVAEVVSDSASVYTPGCDSDEGVTPERRIDVAPAAVALPAAEPRLSAVAASIAAAARAPQPQPSFLQRAGALLTSAFTGGASSSKIAAAAAATKPIATREPPQEVAFFEKWLPQSVYAINAASWLFIVEDVEVLENDVWQPPRRRYISLAIGGNTNAPKCENSVVLQAAQKLHAQVVAKQLPEDAVAAGAITANAKSARCKGCNLRHYADCYAYDQVSEVGFRYGTFPLVPGQISSDGMFRVRYHQLQVMNDDEIKRLPAEVRNRAVFSRALNAANLGGRGSVRLWETSNDTSPAAVDGFLETMYAPAALDRRARDGTLRMTFKVFMGRLVAGYSKASRQRRDEILRQLIAFPRMHMRRLTGSASSRLRDQFSAAQLTGSVCTQNEAIGVPHASSAHRPPPSEEEHVASCVRKAFRYMVEGLVSRAASFLARPMPVEIEAAQKVKDLMLLHPRGLPPRGASRLEKNVFTTSSFSVADIIKSVDANQSGSAPGPDGWTFEMLKDALENPAFATEFHHIVVDMCNGDIADRTCVVLASSALLGIPKGKTAAAGTRPIALGSVLLKVAATQAVRCASKQLAERFRGSQFGCAAKGGGEFVVHTTRRFIRTGVRPCGRVSGARRCVVTIDFANAFNSLSRDAMWEATRMIKELVGIFIVSYAQHTDLHVVGAATTLRSERGARQGTVDGPVTFALALQPVLNAANANDDAQCLAYLDDITILADTPEAAERTVRQIVASASAIGLEVKIQKCELLTVDESMPISSEWTIGKFSRVKTIKLLGASIAASDQLEAAHLFEREENKAAVLLSRMRLGPSPQFLRMLRLCVIPKLSHAVRTHDPAVSRRLCQVFDAQAESVLSYWSSCRTFTDRQRLIMALPTSMGGMGLTRTEGIAPAAYNASLAAALHNEQRATKQSTLCMLIYRKQHDDMTAKDPALKRHLELHALTGSDAGLFFNGARVHADVFGAGLRTMLMVECDTASSAVPQLQCRGCDGMFDRGGAWGQHVGSCVMQKGGHVTKRHNAVVDALRGLLKLAGFAPDATEPRDMAIYDCRCGQRNLPHVTFLEHRKICRQATNPLHVSGPDLRYTRNDETIVADVTIVNLTLATHRNQTAQQAFDAAVTTKTAKYGAVCARNNATLQTLPATANGHLGPELLKVCDLVSGSAILDRMGVRNSISSMIVYRSAACRLAAEELNGTRPPSISLQSVAFLRKCEQPPLELADDVAAAAPAASAAAAAAAPQQRTSSSLLRFDTAELASRIAAATTVAMRGMLPEVAAAFAKEWRLTEAAEHQQHRSQSRARRSSSAEQHAQPAAPSRRGQQPIDAMQRLHATAVAEASAQNAATAVAAAVRSEQEAAREKIAAVDRATAEVRRVNAAQCEELNATNRAVLANTAMLQRVADDTEKTRLSAIADHERIAREVQLHEAALARAKHDAQANVAAHEQRLSANLTRFEENASALAALGNAAEETATRLHEASECQRLSLANVAHEVAETTAALAQRRDDALSQAASRNSAVQRNSAALFARTSSVAAASIDECASRPSSRPRGSLGGSRTSTTHQQQQQQFPQPRPSSQMAADVYIASGRNSSNALPAPAPHRASAGPAHVEPRQFVVGPLQEAARQHFEGRRSSRASSSAVSFVALSAADVRAPPPSPAAQQQQQRTPPRRTTVVLTPQDLVPVDDSSPDAPAAPARLSTVEMPPRPAEAVTAAALRNMWASRATANPQHRVSHLGPATPRDTDDDLDFIATDDDVNYNDDNNSNRIWLNFQNVHQAHSADAVAAANRSPSSDVAEEEEELDENERANRQFDAAVAAEQAVFEQVLNDPCAWTDPRTQGRAPSGRPNREDFGDDEQSEFLFNRCLHSYITKQFAELHSSAAPRGPPSSSSLS